MRTRMRQMVKSKLRTLEMQKEVTLKVNDADEIKPAAFVTVLTENELVYWSGKNWHSLMQKELPVIKYKIRWWTYLPKVDINK